LQTLAGFSLYRLLLYLKLSKPMSFLGGLIYITTPVFFNYSIMGWTFVLMFMGLLPLMVICLFKAVEEKKLKYAVVLGIMYAFSVIQSQAVVWWPIIALLFGIYLIKDKKSLLFFIYTMIISCLLFFLLNFYWIFGLLVVNDTNISGSDIVTSSVSLGTMGHFRPTNIVRLFGSLFNFQYELAIGDSPTLGQSPRSLWSFTLPLIVFASLFLKKRIRLIRALWLISLFPAVMYFLNYFRDLLLYIPFTNLVRDFARFTVISSFAYPVLASLVISRLWVRKKNLAIIIIMVWAVSIYPWWTGEISAWQNRTLGDMRLRVKQFPFDYFELEEKFTNEKNISNSIYFPMNSILDFLDDEKFSGLFGGVVDTFAAYSTMPGSVYVSDRDSGHIGPYLKVLHNLSSPQFRPEFFGALRLTNIRFVVVRKNVQVPNIEAILDTLQDLEDSDVVQKYFSSKNILVYEFKQYYPRIYIPNTIYVTQQPLADLPYLSEDMVVFAQQNPNLRSQDDISPTNLEARLKFTKINSTKYQVSVYGAEGKVPLILNQTFHNQWRVYSVPLENVSESKVSQVNFLAAWFETIKMSEIPARSHLMVNGWANAWTINVDEVCQPEGICLTNQDGSKDFNLIIEFHPQRYFYLGALVTLFTLILSLSYILLYRKKT